MSLQRALMALGLVVGVGVPAGLTAQKESLASSGKTVLLELAPRDPRSLMQGDYMILRYGIARELSGSLKEWPVDGELVIQSDEQDVARFVRRHEGGALADGEQLLRYRVRGQTLRLGAEDFFFQEGTADLYSRARYGELKVTEGGDALLVGLRGEDLQALGPPEANPLQR